MILIITHKKDYTADFIINKLNHLKIGYKRFNCEDVLSYDWTIKFGHAFASSLMGETNFDSVWFRRTMLPEINGLPNGEKFYILNEIEGFIKNIFSVIDANWLSQPFAVYKAENKLYQLKHAQNEGFSIPATLITNCKEELILFYKEHNQNIIAKPINQTRIEGYPSPNFIFTNRVLPEQIDEIDKYDLTPCIFQQNIEKQYEIRVTVVGKSAFAAAVDSQNDHETKTDWRKKKLKFRSVDLPKEINDRCIQIVASLNLEFGAIDLIKTKNNEYIFLEINPNGQWVWIENDTGLEISEAIIDKLSNRLHETAI